MKKHEINAFFEENSFKINEKFVSLLMEKLADKTSHGNKTEVNFREGGSRLTGIIHTALVTDISNIVDYQMEWTKSHIPLEGYPISVIQNMIFIYKEVIQQEYPEELIDPAIGLIDRMTQQMSA